MILKKSNITADRNNTVYINALAEHKQGLAEATLTKYSIEFTNTTDAATITIGGTAYTFVGELDVVADCERLIAFVEDTLHDLGYAWDGEHAITYDIDGTTTKVFTPFSQVVFNAINATAFTAGATTKFGIA